MSVSDDQLVKAIVAQVLEALKARGDQAAGPRADVRPPIGVCTGDYSKFPELAGKRNEPRPDGHSSSDEPHGSSQMPAPLPLSGIITATQLQQAMDRSPEGVAVVATDARLTPLASDLARQRPNKVRRASVLIGRPGSDPSANLPWLWWQEGTCPVVRAVVTEHRAMLRPLVGGSAALAQVIRDLAAAVKSNAAVGGLLFVRSAGRAACLANRNPALRAVVGTTMESFEHAVADVGANVLILEYPHHGQRTTSAMVRHMLASSPRVPPAVGRELSELHRG